MLPKLEETANKDGEARIVMVSSEAVKFVKSPLDYTKLTTRIPGNGKAIKDLGGAFVRYADSKMANMYYAAELSERLRARGINNVYVNSCHPGAAGTTGLADDVVLGSIGVFMRVIAKRILTAIANTAADSAKTQVFLAASKTIQDDDVSGVFWWPTWNWTNRWVGCQKDAGKLPAVAVDMNAAAELWTKSEEAMQKAGVA